MTAPIRPAALPSVLDSADPHRGYAQLRRDSPVCRVTTPDGVPVWLLTRYGAVRSALRDHRLVKGGSARRANGLRQLPRWLADATGRHMLATDPPDHTRLRRSVSGAFTTGRIRQLEPQIRRVTEELLAGLEPSTEVDFVASFGAELPTRVIGTLLGVPPADHATFGAWTRAIVDATAARAAPPDAVAAMLAYIQDLVQRKRRQPADDLLTELIAVHDSGELTANELTSMVFLLLIAGHETTVNLLTSAVFLLLTRPDQLERLRAEPALLPAAVEEFLRYESPVDTATYRITTEPVEIDGHRIPAGCPVLVSLLSANRDAGRFAEPDRLELGRRDNSHLAFGHGTHFCLGAHLARLEAQIAIGSLLHRYPAMRLATTVDRLVWRPSVHLRGLSALPVALGLIDHHRRPGTRRVDCGPPPAPPARPARRRPWG